MLLRRCLILTTISLAGVSVSAGYLPNIETHLSPGSDTYTVTLDFNGAMTSAQITSCASGTTTIAITGTYGTLTYSGSVAGINIRPNYSMVQLSSATLTIT